MARYQDTVSRYLEVQKLISRFYPKNKKAGEKKIIYHLTWSPILSGTTSPTTRSNIEAVDLLPPLTT